jgi:hypothetical protein
MGRTFSTHGEETYAYRVLVGNPESKRLLGRERIKLENNIKMDLRDIGWGGMDWIDLAQERARSIECWGILKWVRNRLLLKKGSAGWS